MYPKKIVQPKLRRRLSKAASELGLHYFMFHLAKPHKFTKLLIYYIISFQRLSIVLNKKVVPNDSFKVGIERVKSNSARKRKWLKSSESCIYLKETTTSRGFISKET